MFYAPTSASTADPVIVIGLPRSGSSYLAHVLSCLRGLWVFDDLYAYQKAAAITFGPMSDHQLATFLDRLAWETRARVIWERDFGVPALDRAGIDALEAELLAEWTGRHPTWSEITEEWMSALATANGAQRWGYKTPQDFLHIGDLLVTWPQTQFLHLLRDPRSILKSYKNLEAGKGTDGDPRSYHPVITALYWRTAQEKIRLAQERTDASITVIRFEDLVAAPTAAADDLASVLGTTVIGDVEVSSFNSSATGSTARPKKALTDTEVWLCERVIGDELTLAGYESSGKRPRVRDVPELIAVSWRFAFFQLVRSVRDPEKRSSVVSFAKRTLTRRG